MIDFDPTDVRFAVPVPAGISPDAEAAGAHLVDWFDRMRISGQGAVHGAAPLDPRQAPRGGSVVGHVLPTGPRRGPEPRHLLQRPAARVPLLCDDLHLDGEQRAGLDRRVEGTGRLLRGIHDVHPINPRYRS